jgi:hypothetical protein
MKIKQLWGISTLFLALLSLPSCKQMAEAPDESQEKHPAVVEHLDGTEPTRVTLTPEAAKRLDVQTAAITNLALNGKMERVIPYAAVLYDTKGNTWTWINSAPWTYVRHPVAIDHIDGDKAVLSKGPDPGTLVVTVGGAELYGSELEFEEE